MAASHHGDTPHSGKPVTSVPVTPYTTSVDVNLANVLLSNHSPSSWRTGRYYPRSMSAEFIVPGEEGKQPDPSLLSTLDDDL